MHLKSIEMQGFKSFAHKIKLEFHNGITGIVGPNGSGKSNVVDAARWVLGEQRIKQLRGGTMSDVIFSGTETRKPLGFAQVAITLDNSDKSLDIDFDEVTVARKIYRSGESEYILNGNVVRLKDINELFYDTGIGKEGYSIIGQGQIDKILSGKPEERRELFDEAIGIVKYKRRKNASIKKLEEEQSNLVRVSDILSELKKQVGPLEAQSKKAKIYLDTKEQLKNYDINLFLLETERLNTQLEETEKSLKISSDELADKKSSYEKMKEEYNSIELSINEIDSKIEEAKNQENQTNILKADLKNNIAVLKEQINSIKQESKHYSSRARKLFDEIRNREEELEIINSELEGLQKQLSEYELKKTELSENVLSIENEINELELSVSESKNNILDILNSRADTKSKIATTANQLEQLKLRGSYLDRRKIEVSTSIKAEENNLKRISTLLDDKNKVVDNYKKDVELLNKKIDDKKDEIGKINNNLSRSSNELHQKTIDLKTLQRLEEDYEGFGFAIKKVMEQKKNNSKVIGVVADLIQIEKKYETAISIALGSNVQNIVTEDDESAKEMIAFLKKNKFGRATFLPLNSIHSSNYSFDKEFLKEEGVIGVASDLVSSEEKYSNLIKNLLSRTYVVEDIDMALKLARKYKYSKRIVTIAGELLNPGGSLTGGAFKKTNNVFSRKREIDELQSLVSELEKTIKNLNIQNEEEKNNRDKLYEDLNLKKQDLNQILLELNTIENEKNQSSNTLDNLKKENKVAEINRSKIEDEIEAMENDSESIDIELEQSEADENRLNEEVSHHESRLDEITKIHEELRIKLEEVNLEYQGIEHKVIFANENRQRIQSEIDNFNHEQENIQLKDTNTSDEIKAKEKEIIDLEERILNSADLIEEILQDVADLKKEKENLNLSHKQFLSDRENLSDTISSIDKEVYRLNTRIENINTQREDLYKYMWEEYELSYVNALPLKDEELKDPAKIKKNISSLKSTIKDLGDVNVNAIEEFKEINDRYVFLNTQYEDIVESEASLREIIKNLDEAMRTKFNAGFIQINEEFNKVFKELFGGGKGTLELEDNEDDVLTASIKIIASPPGKKLQNMMQLSGGEKALTAIALLFAIQNLKPSPFCLLDEIEAALDDGNVDRFAKYLTKMTKNTQMIVITHRRGTMNYADRLYGITMQEKGVSTLVSVKLVEEELDN